MVGSIMNKVIIDESGNETVIEIPKSEADELKALHKQYLDRKAELEAEANAKAEAKAALLAKLGLTEAEAKLLLS